MTPAELAGLLSTAEVLRSWTSVADARAWAGLNEAVLGEFLSLLGNRALSNLPTGRSSGPVDCAAHDPRGSGAGTAAEGSEAPADPSPLLGV